MAYTYTIDTDSDYGVKDGERGIVRDTDGNLYCGVWQSHATDYDLEIHKSTDDGETWSLYDTIVFNESRSQITDPVFSMGIDSNDIIHIAIMYGPSNSYDKFTILYVNSDDGFTSKTVIAGDSTYNYYSPTLTIDGNDVVYIAWFKSGSGSYIYEIANNSNWTTRTNIVSLSSFPSLDKIIRILTDSNNDIYAILTSDTGIDEYKSTDGGSTFSFNASLNITTSWTFPAYIPIISYAIDNSDRRHVALSIKSPSDSYYRVYYANSYKLTSSKWTMFAVTPNNLDIYTVSITQGNAGVSTAIAYVRYIPNGKVYLRYKTSDSPVTFSSENEIYSDGVGSSDQMADLSFLWSKHHQDYINKPLVLYFVNRDDDDVFAYIPLEKQNPSDPASLNDYLARDISQTFSDGSILHDSAEKKRSFFVRDIVYIVDTFSKLRTAIKSFLDKSQISDDIIKKTTKNILHTIKAYSSIIATNFKELNNLTEKLIIRSYFIFRFNGIITALWSRLTKDTGTLTPIAKDTGGSYSKIDKDTGGATPIARDTGQSDWNKTLRDL